MDTQVKVTYEIEVLAPTENYVFVTSSRDEALDFYEQGHIVFEKHHTTTTFSVYNQSQLIASKRWNNNPEFEEEYNNGK